MTHRRFHDQYFDRGLRGWIVSYSKKNLWRVASYIDLDDLIAEGMLAYAICRQRYRHKVENRRHFMALVQVVFANRITDLANAKTNTPEFCISDVAAPGKELGALEYLAGGADGDAELETFLAQAPADVREYLRMLVQDDAKPYERGPGGVRETLDQRIGRALGMSVENVHARMVAFLSQVKEA